VQSMDNLASGLLERVLCTHFSKEAMPSPRPAGGSLHMLARHLMAQLLPLQEPCTVKVASDKEYPSNLAEGTPSLDN
jgi:hypothetical protein